MRQPKTGVAAESDHCERRTTRIDDGRLCPLPALRHSESRVAVTVVSLPGRLRYSVNKLLRGSGTTSKHDGGAEVEPSGESYQLGQAAITIDDSVHLRRIRRGPRSSDRPR